MSSIRVDSVVTTIKADTFDRGFVRRKNDSAALTFYRGKQELCRDLLTEPRSNTSLESIVAVTTLAVFFGLFYILPAVGMAALYYAIVYQDRTAILLTAVLLTDIFLPAGNEWKAFHESRIFDTWRRYFNLRVVLPHPPFLDQTKHHLLVQFPHACFPFGGLLTQTLAGDASLGMPSGPVYGVIASVLLQIPIFKHFFAWVGCEPATSQDLRKLLKFRSVGCIPEGVAGIFQGATRKRERIYIKSRKGYIRLAIQEGADILPIYHLGNSQLLTYCGSEWLSRKARTTIGMFWGWGGLPFPHQHDIVTCVAYPIKVQQIDDPSEEQILDVQRRLLEAVQRLYEQHRHLVGWENRPLEVV